MKWSLLKEGVWKCSWWRLWPSCQAGVYASRFRCAAAAVSYSSAWLTTWILEDKLHFQFSLSLPLSCDGNLNVSCAKRIVNFHRSWWRRKMELVSSSKVPPHHAHFCPPPPTHFCPSPPCDVCSCFLHQTMCIFLSRFSVFAFLFFNMHCHCHFIKSCTEKWADTKNLVIGKLT